MSSLVSGIGGEVAATEQGVGMGMPVDSWTRRIPYAAEASEFPSSYSMSQDSEKILSDNSLPELASRGSAEALLCKERPLLLQ